MKKKFLNLLNQPITNSYLKSIDKKDVELGKDDFDFNEQDEKKDNEVSKFLQKLDLDNLSPKESLDILYALKKNYFIE